MLQQPRVDKLAAAIYERWRAEPLQVLLFSRETADLYVEGVHLSDNSMSGPAALCGIEDREPYPFLTRILATLGRQLVGKLDDAELRAYWRLSNDEAAHQQAVAKTKALDQEEGEWLAKLFGQ